MGWIGIPPDYVVHERLKHLPLDEQVPRWLRERGDVEAHKRRTDDGKHVVIGVADTGVSKHHSAGDLNNVMDAWDWTNSPHGPYDRNGHGSWCLSCVGARSDSQGIWGHCGEAKLYSAKCLGDDGGGASSWIAKAFYKLADAGCHLINASLGGGFSNDIEGACRELEQQGVFVIAAMGNDPNRNGHPGNSRFTVGGSAVDFFLKPAPFTSPAEHTGYADYGVNVYGCDWDDGYQRSSGTSMATPQIVGVLGGLFSHLLKHGQPLPKNIEELHELVKPGLKDIHSPGWDVKTGHGFIDQTAMLDAIETEDPVDPVDPPPGEDGDITLGAVYHDGGLTLMFPGGDERIKLTVDGKSYNGSGATF